MLLLACAVCRVICGGSNTALANEIDRTSAAIENSTCQITRINAELEEAQLELAGNLSVRRQPDWGVLLAVVGKCLQDDAVLQHCRLVPVDRGEHGSGPAQGSPGETSFGQNEEFVYKITGYAESHAAAAEFVKRLRETALFYQVSLTRTNLHTTSKGRTVEFELQCALSDKTKMQ